MSTGPGAELRRLRHFRGVSLRQVERATGINRGKLSHVEDPPTLSEAEFEAYLAALGIHRRKVRK